MLKARQIKGRGKYREPSRVAFRFARPRMEPAPLVGAVPVTPLPLVLRPEWTVGPLAAILLAMTAIVVFLPVMADLAGHSPQQAIPRSLDFRQEANIPTLFSVAILSLAAVLSAIAGRDAAQQQNDRPMTWRWYGLAVVFLFLAVDEGAMIHEGFNKFQVGASGALAFMDKFPWIWFYGAGAAVIGLFYLPFLMKLPRHTAAFFFFGGLIFVTGAIGLELLGAWDLEVRGGTRDSLAYILRGDAEEFCEMAGVLLFIWGLLRYLGGRGLRLDARFESDHRKN